MVRLHSCVVRRAGKLRIIITDRMALRGFGVNRAAALLPRLVLALLALQTARGGRLRVGVSPDSTWAGRSGYDDAEAAAGAKTRAAGGSIDGGRKTLAAVDSGDAEQQAAAIAALVSQRDSAASGCGGVTASPCESRSGDEIMRSLGLRPGGVFSIRASTGFVFYSGRGKPAIVLSDEQLDTAVDPLPSVRHAYRFIRGGGQNSDGNHVEEGWCVESARAGTFWHCDESLACSRCRSKNYLLSTIHNF